MLLDEKRLLNLYDEILNVVKSRTATWNSVDELLSGIEKVSRKPNFTFSDNFTEAVNIVRRCMKMVTDSKVTTKALDVPESSLFNVIMGSARVTEKTKLTEKELDELKDDVLEAVKEAKYSFEAHVEEISRHAFDFLKPHDKVLIWGYSELTSSFVQSAIDSKSRKTPITLLVSGPKGEALRVQKMLEKHTESKVLHINIIGDGGFFSVMPIVQKVLIPVTALLPDGNLRAPGGTRAICLAARAHSVPVLALCPMHKICADFPVDECELIKPDHPNEVKPAWDIVKSNLVSLVITSEGGIPPSDTYRLHNEMYHQGDWRKTLAK